MTFELVRTKKNGKVKEMVFIPNKIFKVNTKDERKIKIKNDGKIVFLDSGFVFNRIGSHGHVSILRDTLYFQDIKSVYAKTKGYRLRNSLYITAMVIGGAYCFVVFELALLSFNPNIMIPAVILGASWIVEGQRLQNNKYNTKKRWTLKSGYYK
ncbi:MAG: hypothetical protein HXX09_07295 [Bacteroidetes bacterium]|nr:hypothetical protein [Bacteroidota bacterium]